MTIQNITDEYTINEQIGTGTYGVVYSVFDLSGNNFAMKISKISETLIHPTILNEISVLKILTNHPNIIKLHKVNIYNIKIDDATSNIEPGIYICLFFVVTFFY